MSLLDLPHGFRDEHQRQSAQAIVMQRLADDREQEECRVLMKFWWQLAMPYEDRSDPLACRRQHAAQRGVGGI